MKEMSIASAAALLRLTAASRRRQTETASREVYGAWNDEADGLDMAADIIEGSVSTLRLLLHVDQQNDAKKIMDAALAETAE